MNNIDARYQALLEDILHWGVEKTDRTGTGTISVFGRQIRHNMKDGFPLLTTKKIAWKTMVTELLWFLRGDTNIKFLVDNGCHIWDGDAYKNYCNAYPNVEKTFKYEGSDIEVRKMTKDEFINMIKTDDEFAKQWGELGPIYGKQWRDWNGKDEVKLTNEKDENGYLKFEKNHIAGVDQIQNLINELKTNPDSRRLMVNAWNVGNLEKMILPPCHYGFQMYTRELSESERLKLIGLKDNVVIEATLHNIGEERSKKRLDRMNIPTRAISLMWNQRSVDTFLGLPFNIASYGLLLEIIAKEVNMVPDELIGNLGDVHLYSNHIEQAKEQIERTPYELPKVKITERNWYMHESVKEHLGEKTLNEKIMSYRPDCFELIDYQSHPKIVAPLSN
jgi:thymidylate synthase